MQCKLFLAALIFSGVVMAEQSQLDQHVKCPTSSDKAYRVLFVGDSITRHSFNADTIKELGWSHVSGMGASSENTDYANQLVEMIAKDRKQPVVKCFHTYGGSGSVPERLAGLPMVADTKPDLVVLQLGEHDDATTDPALFHSQYAALVRQVRAMSSRPKVIAVGPWSLAPLNAKGEYSDGSAAVDREMYSVAIEETLEYLSIRDMAAIPEAHGWGASEGGQVASKRPGSLNVRRTVVQAVQGS